MSLIRLVGFSVLFFCSSVFARNLGTVSLVDLDESKVVFSLKSTEVVAIDDLVNIEINSSSKCIAKVKQVNPGSVVASIINCNEAKAIKPQQQVSYAKPGEKASEAPHGYRYNNNLPTENESWYYVLQVSLPHVKYDSGTEQAIKNYEDLTDSKRNGVGLEFLAFYWPINDHHSMAGFSYRSTTEVFSDDDNSSITSYSLAISAYHFFGANIGNGLFIRGDFGRGWYAVSSDTNVNSSDNGTSFLLGVGYALPFGKETRLLFSLLHNRVKADGTQADITSINAGLLF